MSVSIASSRKRIATFAFSLMFAFGFLSQTGLLAQQFIMRQAAGANRDLAMYEQHTQQLEQKKQAAENRIAFRLADLDHACQLTNEQRTKLTIAGKGAVNSYMVKATEDIKKAAKQAGFDFDPGNPPEKTEEAEDANLFQAQQVFVIRNGVLDQGENAVEEQKIWKSAVKKTLTEQQVEQVQTWAAERQSLLEKAAVDNFIARVDLKLLLSQEQREKLSIWVDENFAQQLAERVGNSLGQFQQVVLVNGVQQQEPDSIHVLVATILTESQRQTWAITFQRELDQLKGLNNNMAIPAVRLLPAINLAPAVKIGVDIDN